MLFSILTPGPPVSDFHPLLKALIYEDYMILKEIPLVLKMDIIYGWTNAGSFSTRLTHFCPFLASIRLQASPSALHISLIGLIKSKVNFL